MTQMITVNKRIEMFMKIMMKSGINEDFTAWLIDQGFFTAPASTKYHGNYEGGLFDHCLEVTESLVNFTEKMGIEWEHPRSPYIVGMFHDLCKLDSYEKVIDVEGVHMMGLDTPKGEESHWEYRSDSLFPGHGDKSIMKLASWLQLTEEEILCIRYHMGAYDGKEYWDYYDRAIRKYETVLWTHQADMYASKVKGV